jgi:hypothetical protein
VSIRVLIADDQQLVRSGFSIARRRAGHRGCRRGRRRRDGCGRGTTVAARHAGGPEGSEKAASATGRWVAAITAVCSRGRSAASASWNFAGSIATSVAVSAPFPVGYCRATCAVMRTLSLDVASTSPSRSPSSGAKAATKTKPATLPASAAAFEITAPAYEWPRRARGRESG